MKVIHSKLLSSLPGFIHGFSTRELGASLPAIAAHLHLELKNLFQVKQIHSAQVISLNPTHKPEEISQRQADALIASTNQWVGVRTADCLPILVADIKGERGIAIHAGWRGCVGGVIESALHSLEVKNLFAAIGPALCESCFEVGPEVADEFRAKWEGPFKAKKGREDRFHLDLKSLAQDKLLRMGIPSSQIEVLPHCTRCEPDLFYSYRRGDLEGRQFSLIGKSRK